MDLGVGSACRGVCALVCAHACVCTGHGHVHVYVIRAGVCVCVYTCSGVCVWVCVAGRRWYFSSAAGTCLRASSRGTGRQPVTPRPGTLLVPCGHCPLGLIVALQSRIVACLPF